jgi:hypothetical protein
MDCMETHLRPRTLRPTIGTRPLQTLRSNVRRSGRMRMMSATRKSMTAIPSCVARKKSGAGVVFRTHLFLHVEINTQAG